MVAISSVRDAGAADAIDGLLPRLVVEPDSVDRLAETLAAASRERRSTVVRGGGTKLGWGRIPAPVELVLSMSRLSTLLVHRHGDLTVTVGAGVRLASLNQTLAEHGQWLPVDSAFEDATIGGILATNDAGPLRHRFGTPRDLLIGITLALADGRVVKAGGNVVKNVAGYDLGKLVCGSFGALAAIVDATFKLLPLPSASATLAVTYGSPEALAHDAAAIAASQVEPVAFDIRASDRTGHELLVRFASSPAATDAQISQVRSKLTSEAAVVTGERESALWTGQLRVPWMGEGTVVRMSWLPSKLLEVLSIVRTIHQATGNFVALAGRASGAGFLRLEGDAQSHVAAIEKLRSTTEVGNVVVLRASREVKQRVDVWGPPGDSMRVARALKQTLDPAGILNAGRGPI